MPHEYKTYHIILSTENRTAQINDSVKMMLLPVISQWINQHIGYCHIANGTHDHIHILCDIAHDVLPSQSLKSIKKHSQQWINDNMDLESPLQWAHGGLCFPVQKQHTPQMFRTIRNQDEQHEVISFTEECEIFFKKGHIPAI